MQRSDGRWMAKVISALTVATLAMGALTSMPAARAATSTIADDGQATLKFSTVGGVNGFRTTNTIPYWSSSFTFGGASFPYSMVGSAPSTNSSTTIPTVLIPMKFVFSPSSNFGGGTFSDVRDPLTADPATGLNSVQATLQSPIFQNASFPLGVGTTQFGDAIQRATFDKTGANGYHVLLGTPTVLPEVTIDVPANLADVHRISARMDATWFSDRLNELMRSLNIDPKTLPIFVTYNTFLFVGHDPTNCCIGGYHGAATPQCRQVCAVNGNGAQPVHTFMFAGWVSPGVFRNPSVLDITPLSHEVSEWLNDPFTDNLVPPWLALGPAPFCQNNLETGDVLEELSNAGTPVTVNGITYHPQSEALLPWFERQSPSTAVGGAYSYPDTTLAPTFAQSC